MNDLAANYEKLANRSDGPLLRRNGSGSDTKLGKMHEPQ